MLEYSLFFLGGLGISYIVNKLVLNFSKNLGIRNKNDVVVRWCSDSKPSLGGISFYFVFICAVMVYASVYSETNPFSEIEFVGLIAAGSLAFGIGLVDDTYDTRPLLKLFGQIMCGVILVATGNSIDFFHNFWLDAGLTVFWIVAIMNSLNMLDNMDGIAGSTSFFIVLSCVILLTMFQGEGSLVWILLLLVQLGGIVGFMLFNVHPSRMFMGDSGSQFISLFVGYFGIKAIWNLPSAFEFPSWTAAFIVLVAFVPTVVDTLTVMINRKRKGGSVMVGGKDHTTHHLVYKGYSDFQVWLIFVVLGLLSTLLAVILAYFIFHGQYFVSFFGFAFFLTVFIPLFRNTLKYHPPEED